MAEQLWTLKILAGVHAGAEVTLSDEEATLGRDDVCDFVLDDAGVADRHLRLRTDPDGVRLTVLDPGSPVAVDGKPVEGGLDLQPYQVVSCGGLALAVGPVGQAWPNIELPASPLSVPEAEPLDMPDEPQTEEPAIGPVPATAPDSAADAPSLGGRRPVLTAAAVAGVLVVAAGAWLLVPRDVERHYQSPADTTAQIRAIASPYGALIDFHTEEGNGSLSVIGTVDTEETRARLLEDLANANVRATVHIDSTEQIAEFAMSVLNQSLNLDEQNAIDVLPVAGSPGEVLVSGYVRDEGSLDGTRAILERDVRGARGFTYQVQTKDERLAILRDRLDALGTAQPLRIQELVDRVGLFGPVASQGDLSRIEALVEQFNDEFDSRPRLALSGTDSFLGESTIDLDVRAVVLGEDVHVVLHDGSSVATGSEIADGYVIRTVTPSYMILEQPHHRIPDGTTPAPTVAFFIFDL